MLNSTPEDIYPVEDTLSVLPLKNMTLFPGVMMPVVVTRERAQRLVQAAAKDNSLLVILCQKDRDIASARRRPL